MKSKVVRKIEAVVEKDSQEIELINLLTYKILFVNSNRFASRHIW